MVGDGVGHWGGSCGRQPAQSSWYCLGGLGSESKYIPELHKHWCAVLGLNQSRLAKRRGRFRLICYLRTFAVPVDAGRASQAGWPQVAPGDGLIAVAGWSTRDMIDHYTKATASERAAAEARNLG